jgi:hypothetical protein
MPQAGSGFPQADCRPLARTVNRRPGHADTGFSADPLLLPRREEIAETDAPEKLGANPIGDDIDHLTAVLRRVDVRAERACAEGHVHDLDDGIRDGHDVRVGRYGRGEALLDLRS